MPTAATHRKVKQRSQTDIADDETDLPELT